MPNEFDKILNEKLEGYEASFNPADWQKMEALLPQDSRKFLFVMTSLFAVLFVATSTLMMNNLLNSSGDEKTSAIAVSENRKKTDAEHSSMKHDRDNAETGGSEQSESLERDNIKTGNTTDRIDLTANSSPGSSNTLLAAKTHDAESGANEKDMRKIKAAHVVVSSSKNQSKPLTHRMTGSHPLSDAPHETYLNETAGMLAMINAGAIGSGISDEPQIPSLEAMESVFNKKKKVFEFGLGLVAGTGISFIDATNLTKPGYAVGMSQELMFVNRAGLVIGESYSFVKYDGGGYPCPAGYGNCPNGYSSNVKSFNLGIDLKVNIINKARWNWYAKAGIVNTFKLEELFEFRYPDVDTIAPPQVPSTQTNFNGLNNSSFEDALSVTDPNVFAPNPEPLPDLTISGQQRFHLAYHFATGFDVKLNSRMKIQIETGYSFTNPTVGPDDKRLHTIGLNWGFFYTFAKYPEAIVKKEP